MMKRRNVLLPATSSTFVSSVIDVIMLEVTRADRFVTTNLPMVNIDDQSSQSRILPEYHVGARNRTHNECE